MVKGLDKFREYFSEFSKQYVLIGGSACDISFREEGADFRATKDLDIVLIVEALTEEFGRRFWEFLEDGGYQHRARSDGRPQFYRFEKPKDTRFPKMIELFARTDEILSPDRTLVPLYIDEGVSSLSAILLDEAYYRLLMEGRTVIDGVSILSATYLILFKIKAWKDLSEKREAGKHVDSRDIKKHRNDILRMVSELTLEAQIELSAAVKREVLFFIHEMQKEDPDLKVLGLKNVKLENILNRLEETYCGQ